MILIVKTNSGGYDTIFMKLPEAFNEYFLNITEEFKFWRLRFEIQNSRNVESGALRNITIG